MGIFGLEADYEHWGRELDRMIATLDRGIWERATDSERAAMDLIVNRRIVTGNALINYYWKMKG